MGRRLGTLLFSFLAALGAPAAAAAPQAGTSGLGDPFFPGAGNGGYRVSHYDVTLEYRPASGFLDAKTVVRAKATQALRAFNLDFRGPRVTALSVDGRRASFKREGPELIVRSPVTIRAAKRFRVTVTYRGRPGPVIDPDGSSEGWIRTDDGAFVVGEPLGTTAWIPSNNNPMDKASLTTRITVPHEVSAISNGRLIRVTRAGARHTFTWREGQPMAPYLATLDIGQGRIEHGRAAGIPSWTLVDPRERAKASAPLKAMPRVLRFLEGIYGPYPFDSTGSTVDHDAGVGYSLETQTRPIYDGAPDLSTLVHEQAHQWFGDSVTFRQWPEIWLAEGFATWTEWYYSERFEGPSAATIFRRLYATPASTHALWDPPPGNPGKPANLFSGSVYERGAMTLQALRETIGDEDFFRLLRAWPTLHRRANATIPQFIGLAERTSGRRLDAFFKRWLFSPGKPPGGPLASPSGVPSAALPASSRR